METQANRDEQSHSTHINGAKPTSGEYSEAMVDTIFADTLSRGMQNAITSQQNAQMASSTSITNACARILQARASAPIKAPIKVNKANAGSSMKQTEGNQNPDAGSTSPTSPTSKANPKIKVKHAAYWFLGISSACMLVSALYILLKSI